MTAIPTKLYEAFERIRLGRVDEGLKLFDRIDGFDTIKAAPLAELSYFRHDWKHGIQFSLDFLASGTDRETVRYFLNDYQKEHLELILVATCQIGCWKETRSVLHGLKKKLPNIYTHNNYDKFHVPMSLVSDPVNTARRLTESKPKLKTDGKMDMDYLETRIKHAFPAHLTSWKHISCDNLASSAYSEAPTEVHLAFYEQYLDRLENAKSHLEAALSYIAAKRIKDAKEAIRLYMQYWKYRERYQVAPIILFTNFELWPILSDRHFTESLLTIPHNRES